jgi:NAD(P)-dependent dehydrogenase (short-subunit alcohol dehydrogenase family)
MERIVVTGASRGIGRAIAVRLASAGRELILHGRDADALAATAAAVEARGAEARVVTGDLAVPTDVDRLVDVASAGAVDVLVNNAGSAVVKPLAEVGLEEWERSLALNVTAPFLLVRGLLPRLKAGSSVVNLLSVAARRGFPGWSAYCAAKFALEGFSQSLREEVRGRGIRVINVYPSATDSGLWDGISGVWPRERMLDPERVAGAVAFALEQPPSVLVESIELGHVSGAL